MKNEYKKTMTACFAGYIVQALVNNFLPLLFMTFRSEFAIHLSDLTWLITVNFAVQLMTDALSPLFVDRIGYRASMLIAHGLAAAGFVLLSFLPDMLGFPGIIVCVVMYAVGGGLLEVLVSPIVEACPTENKETAMALLHSFYCWGQAATVLISACFFFLFGTGQWRILSVIWAVLPVINFAMFTKVPIAPLIGEGEKGLRPGEIIKNRSFLLFAVMMICAGACELTVSQWASAFAESGLHISKSLGDLLGPMGFAVFMGIARAVYGKFGERISLKKAMTASAVLCLTSYLIIGLSDNAALGLIGCMLCGFSAGIFWPGTFSMAAAGVKNGGTLMFALLALAGDIGCCGGPTLAGIVSSLSGDDLHSGILIASVFPVLMTICLCVPERKRRAAGKMR
jgi:MFS family permease